MVWQTGQLFSGGPELAPHTYCWRVTSPLGLITGCECKRPVSNSYRVALILRLWCLLLIESERQLIFPRLSKVRLLTIAALCLAAIGGFSTWFINKYFGVEAQALAVRIWPPPTTDQVENKELRKIAGWFSLDCGHVRYREDADRAIACAQDALKARRRFYVAF